MITQTIKTDLLQNKLDTIIFRSQEEGREIAFVIVDDDGEPVDLTGYELKFYMAKPDNNIIVETLTNGILAETEQMTTARGMGFYTIRLYSVGVLIYTGQGRVMIDDHVYDDDMLDSISEVDGLIFPDDFLTRDTPVAVIEDNHCNYTETWSSQKIADEILGVAENFIKDDTISSDYTWSSDKINSELLEKAEMNDNAESSQTTWSSEKIAEEIAANSPIHQYSTTPQIVGKWLNNENVVEVTYDFGSAGISLLSGQWVDYSTRIIPSNAKVIRARGISVNNAGGGWTSYQVEVYQPVADNSYLTLYCPGPNGLWCRYLIVEYFIPA